jgi:hypothetical protein
MKKTVVVPGSKKTEPKLPYVFSKSHIIHTTTHHGKIDAMFD